MDIKSSNENIYTCERNFTQFVVGLKEVESLLETKAYWNNIGPCPSVQMSNLFMKVVYT